MTSGVTAVLSMLHEGPAPQNSAARLFLDRPVLRRTLQRLRECRTVDAVAILCWEDQLPEVTPIAAEADACVLAKGPRCAVPPLDSVTAARRWSDGWRGGLLQTCEFDRGFYAPWLLEMTNKLGADDALLIDPAAGLLDPSLVDALVDHAAANGGAPLVFSQAAPGLSGVFLRGALIKQLASISAHPGRFIHYQPQHPAKDPISEPACAPVPTPVARSVHRFTLDSRRQLERLGRLVDRDATPGAEALVRARAACDLPDRFPREVVVELTTRRATRPIFLPAGHLAIERPELTVNASAAMFADLGGADDVRVTFAGVGDPLLAPAFFDHVAAAHAAGIRAIHCRTDLLDVTPQFLRRLAEAPMDVISIHVPAISARTYLATMGVDALARVLDNVKSLVEQRWSLQKMIPILVPVFTKCRENLHEMETWYDKWLAALGSAVIAGPSDFAGQIPDHAVADMRPPARRPCNRLASRLHVLSSGSVAPCEQDCFARQTLGDLKHASIEALWSGKLAALRTDHRRGQWDAHALCAACKEWHRP